MAAGRDVKPYIRSLEAFANCGMLAEQVWDGPDRPAERLWLGRPTGAAMPLVWAHAEYLTLLRSAADGQPFDYLPQVAARYGNGNHRSHVEFWKPNRHAPQVATGNTLRVQAPAEFVLRWTANEWKTVHDTQAHTTPLGISYVDIPIARGQRAPVRFTFRWTLGERWEGRDYTVTVTSD